MRFVNVAWDGGTHAFLLDTCVDLDRQGEGVGAELVRRATAAPRGTGCDWLHVDFEAPLEPFLRALRLVPHLGRAPAPLSGSAGSAREDVTSR